VCPCYEPFFLLSNKGCEETGNGVFRKHIRAHTHSSLLNIAGRGKRAERSHASFVAEIFISPQESEGERQRGRALEDGEREGERMRVATGVK
jgi:hypothetical protein